MTMHASNLMMALRIAIDARREEERRMGYTGESAFLAGIVSVYEALGRGEQVWVKQEGR